MKTKYVYLGRFSPFHLGHESIVKLMVDKYGTENILIIIGSSTSNNERTPYSFEKRKEMINAVFPDLKIIPLPDTEPGLAFFRQNTNDIWLENIEKLAKGMDAEFVFFGGSGEDLKILGQKFKTEILVDRQKSGNNISATLVRQAFNTDDLESAKKMLDPKVFKLALEGYLEYQRSAGDLG